MRSTGHGGFSLASLPRAVRHLPALLGVALLFGAIYAVQREFRHLQLDDIESAVSAITPRSLGLALLFTALSYTMLTLYDRLGTIYAGHAVAYRKVAFASFCAYALAHNLGFSAFSGGAVRYRLYTHWGLTPLQIAKVVAFCGLSFSLGGMVVGGTVLFAQPRSIPYLGQHLPLAVLYTAGALLFGVVLAYFTASLLLDRISVFGQQTDMPGWRMALGQILLATADVSITATIFWVLLPHAAGLTWLLFLGVYVGSFTAGLAVNLPGGLGVFDSAILFGLAPFMPADRIVAAILVFRLFYYVIPLFLAGTLFATNEALLHGPRILTRMAQRSGLDAIARWSEPDLAVAGATGSVALSGLLLLGVGVLSRRTPDLSWADPDLAGLGAHAGQFAPSLIGAGLLVLGIGLAQRVALAWWSTIVLLALGAIYIAVEGERGWIAGILVLSGALIAPFRSFFYRRARLFRGPVEPGTAASLLALAVCVLALAGFRHRMHGLANNAWWEIVLSSHMPWALRASVAVTVAVALVAVWSLVRPCHVRWYPWDADTRHRVQLLGALPLHADGVVWGENEGAAIQFRRIDRILLGLGDPIGAEADRVSAIWQFRDLARQEGRDPAIWHAGPGLLNVYGDLGLVALPLGSDGLPLPEVPDETPQAEQYLLCVADRDVSRLMPLLPDLAKNVGETRPCKGRST